MLMALWPPSLGPEVPGGVVLSGLPTILDVETPAVAVADESDASELRDRQDESTFLVIDVFQSTSEQSVGMDTDTTDEALAGEESFLPSLEELIEDLT